MIERTKDYRRVKRLALANPIDQDTPWDLIISSDVIYLIEVKDGVDVGVWCFEPKENGEYDMHTAMAPECRGKAAIESGLDAIRWFYENTDANKIIAPVPKNLKHAQRIPRAAGLVYEGVQGERKIYKMNRELFNNLSEVA
jgi:hypothetical protein